MGLIQCGAGRGNAGTEENALREGKDMLGAGATVPSE